MVRRSKRKSMPVPPVESHPTVFRVEFDSNDEPVLQRLLLFEGKERFALKTDAGQEVYSAPYLSVRVQRTLGSSPRDALQTCIAALEASASEARAELKTTERQLLRAREALAKLEAR